MRGKRDDDSRALPAKCTCLLLEIVKCLREIQWQLLKDYEACPSCHAVENDRFSLGRRLRTGTKPACLDAKNAGSWWTLGWHVEGLPVPRSTSSQHRRFCVTFVPGFGASHHDTGRAKLSLGTQHRYSFVQSIPMYQQDAALEYIFLEFGVRTLSS